MRIPFHFKKKCFFRTSLVVHWLRICLPMQGTYFQSLVWEDPTCCRATKSVRQDSWARDLEFLPYHETAAMKSLHTTLEGSPCLPQLEKAPIQQWRPSVAENKHINKKILKRCYFIITFQEKGHWFFYIFLISQARNSFIHRTVSYLEADFSSIHFGLCAPH